MIRSGIVEHKIIYHRERYSGKTQRKTRNDNYCRISMKVCKEKTILSPTARRYMLKKTKSVIMREYSKGEKNFFF
jgi:hypothetical protein